MGQDGIAVGERQPQILTSAPRFSKRTTRGLQLEIGRTCQVASYRARMQHLYANDGASGDAGGETTAHHFNLRKFGHRSRPAVLPRSEGTRFSSSSDEEVGGLQGAIAASGASNLAWLG